MYILRADTGQAIEVNISPGASVQSLREMIASIAPIAPQDQILLVEGKRLDTNRTLEYYGIPSKEKEVFLFNRKALVDPNFPIEESIPQQIETQIPSLRPLGKEYESKPLIHALKSYEHQFHGHFLIAQAIREAFERRLYSCKMCFSEIHVQVRGIECAIMNLNDHLGQLVRSHEDFTAHAKLQIMESDELIENLNVYFDKLKEVHIHPSLATPGTTLFDLIPEAKLRLWAESSRTDHERAKLSIPAMENQLRQLQHEIDAEIHQPNDVDLQQLSDRIFHSEEVLKDLLTKLQMFDKDFANVRNRVELALRSTQQNLGNFCDGFDEIAKVHEAHLNYLRAQDEASKENLIVFARCKSKLSRGVFGRIRGVSGYQGRIRDSHNTMAVMGEVLNKLKSAFSQFMVIRNMPKAYYAAIQEVSRRRGFAKKLRRETLRMNETMAKIRDEEVPKRDSFINKWFFFVPKDLVPGLQEPLPILEVSIPAVDTNLPQIDSDSIGEEDDFTIVPFGDEPMPRLQSFDKENAFSQSGSTNYSYNNTNNNNNNNNNYNPNTSIPPPSHYSNPPTSHNPTPAPTPASNPIPITSTKGFSPAPPHTSSGPLSASPGSSDVIKLQKDLAAAKEVSTNYAARITHLEGELEKLYKEKVERTHQDNAQIGSRAEIDGLKAKISEQEHQIERLMTALHTKSEPLVTSARAQDPAQTQTQTQSDAEWKKKEAEWTKKEAEWEQERKDAAEKYEEMRRQLAGELEHLREEKLYTSRSWNNEKMELEKTQKKMEKQKETFEEEKKELESTVKDLQEKVKQQDEGWAKDKRELAQEIEEIKAASEENTKRWEANKKAIMEDYEKEKQAILEEYERKEAKLKEDLTNETNSLLQMRSALKELQNKAEKLEADLASTEQKLQEKEQELEKVEKEKEEFKEAMGNLGKVITQKSAAIDALRDAQEKADQNVLALQTKLDELQVTCNKLSSQKEELAKSIENVNTEKEKLANTNAALTQQVEKHALTLRAKEAALADAAGNFKAVSDKLKEKEEDANKKEAAMRKELQDAQAVLQARERELRDAEQAAREKDDKLASSQSILGERDSTLRAHLDALREKDAALLAKDSVLREKDVALQASETALREKTVLLQTSETALREKTAALQASETTLREKDAALQASETTLRERDTALQASEAVVREKDAALQASEAALRAKDAALREKDDAIAQGEEMSRSVANLSELLDTREKGFSESVLDYERKLELMEERQKQEEMDRYRMFELEREEMMTAHNTQIGLLQAQITELQTELKKQDSGPQILALKNETTELKNSITALQTQIKEMGATHTQEMDSHAQKYIKREAEINEISVQIQKKNSVLEKKMQEAEEDKRRMQQQLDQHAAIQIKDEQLKKVVAELSANLKNHTACQNLRENDTDEIAQFQTRISAVIAFAHGLEEERDHTAVSHATESSQLRTLLQSREDRIAELERKLQDAQGQLVAWEMNQNESVPNKISFSKFKPGDLVLFVPKNKSHEAFNINCPNYYLSEDCAALYENQTYVCGQVIEINSRKATSRDNPFRVPEGSEFHEVTITSI